MSCLDAINISGSSQVGSENGDIFAWKITYLLEFDVVLLHGVSGAYGVLHAEVVVVAWFPSIHPELIGDSAVYFVAANAVKACIQVAGVNT